MICVLLIAFFITSLNGMEEKNGSEPPTKIVKLTMDAPVYVNSVQLDLNQEGIVLSTVYEFPQSQHLQHGQCFFTKKFDVDNDESKRAFMREIKALVDNEFSFPIPIHRREMFEHFNNEFHSLKYRGYNVAECVLWCHHILDVLRKKYPLKSTNPRSVKFVCIPTVTYPKPHLWQDFTSANINTWKFSIPTFSQEEKKVLMQKIDMSRQLYNLNGNANIFVESLYNIITNLHNQFPLKENDTPPVFMSQIQLQKPSEKTDVDFIVDNETVLVRLDSWPTFKQSFKDYLKRTQRLRLKDDDEFIVFAFKKLITTLNDQKEFFMDSVTKEYYDQKKLKNQPKKIWKEKKQLSNMVEESKEEKDDE